MEKFPENMVSNEQNISPLVSIIIPSYNYGRFLDETLNCLLDQKLSNWECLVIDDGYTDNTKMVALTFADRDRRIRYFYQENQGQPAARNKGLPFARGKYIQFLDSDDLLEGLKLEVQANFLDNHPDTDIVYGE